MSRRTRVSFWARKQSRNILDKRVKRIHDKLSEISDELIKLENYIFKEFTKPTKVIFYVRRKV